MKFLKTTIIGGVVFLVPVIVFMVIVGKAAALMLGVATPVAEYLPIDSVGDIAIVNLLAVLLVVLVCFLAGLVARTARAKRTADKMEAALLDKIPGYTMLKGMTSSISDEQESTVKPVLVALETTERIGFEIERLDDGRVVILFPGSPNALSGTSEIVSANRVSPLNTTMSAVIESAQLMGRGTGKLLS